LDLVAAPALSHVDYLCPICSSRIGTARIGAYSDPLEKVRCETCHRTFRFHDALSIPRWRSELLKGAPLPPDIRIPKGVVTRRSPATPDLTIPNVSLSQGSTLLVGAMDTNDLISDPPTTVACTWNSQSVPQRLAYLPVNPPGSSFGPRVILFELNDAPAGSGPISIVWTGDPSIGQLNAFATELRLGPSPDNLTGTNDANDTEPNATLSGSMAQANEVFIGVLAAFGNAADLAMADAVGCNIGQNTASTGSAIIELFRIDSQIHTPTTMALTGYSVFGRLWSMIVADFKIP
jgi:hypothetical protein